MPLRLSRRAKILAGVATAVLAGLALYARFVEPYRIQLTEYHLAEVADPLRIVQLSDFHVEDDNGLERVRRAVEITKSQKPHLIVITGDFFTNLVYRPQEYRALLSRLPEIAPTYAIGGNHDGGFWADSHGGYPTTAPLRDFLLPTGIRYLENRTDSLTLQDRKLEIYGSGDVWARRATHDTEAIFSSSPKSLKIVLTHNPDSKFLFLNDPWNLMFAGHTHGGQASIPFLGAPLVPIRDKRYTRGHFTLDDRHLIVSSGIGCIWGLRFNAPPEVVLVEI